MRAKYENDAQIARSKRDFELKKASYDIEVETKVTEYVQVDQSLNIMWLNIL